MDVILNGVTTTFEEDALSLLDLIKRSNLKPDSVVVDYNGMLHKADTFQSVMLRNGDQLDIVHFMGGGQVL